MIILILNLYFNMNSLLIIQNYYVNYTELEKLNTTLNLISVGR